MGFAFVCFGVFLVAVIVLIVRAVSGEDVGPTLPLTSISLAISATIGFIASRAVARTARGDGQENDRTPSA
jgi:hypothetical protein